MKKVIVFNDSGVNVDNYPISEAMLDGEGNLVVNTGTGEYISTGRTYEWSIQSKEKILFPEYIALVLKQRYDFLKIMPEDAVVDEVEKIEPAKEVDDDGNKVFICKYCKKTFDNAGKLGRHKGLAHAEQVARE